MPSFYPSFPAFLHQSCSSGGLASIKTVCGWRLPSTPRPGLRPSYRCSNFWPRPQADPPPSLAASQPLVKELWLELGQLPCNAGATEIEMANVSSTALRLTSKTVQESARFETERRKTNKRMKANKTLDECGWVAELFLFTNRERVRPACQKLAALPGRRHAQQMISTFQDHQISVNEIKSSSWFIQKAVTWFFSGMVTFDSKIVTFASKIESTLNTNMQHTLCAI